MREVVKVTISLPSALLQLADETAQAGQKPRSGVIRDALASYIKEREHQEMIKGYEEMAAMNRPPGRGGQCGNKSSLART